MKKISSIVLSISVGLAFLTTSCVKELDFGQIETLQVKPILTGDLVYFEYSALALSLAQQPLVTGDTTEIRIFNDYSFVEKYTYKAEIYIEFTNTIPKAFNAEVFLLDDENNATPFAPVSPIPIPAHVGSVPNPIKITKTFEASELPELLSTTKLAIGFTTQNQQPINATDGGYITLKSTGMLYLLVE